jgi:hypothetical protein
MGDVVNGPGATTETTEQSRSRGPAVNSLGPLLVDPCRLPSLRPQIPSRLAMRGARGEGHRRILMAHRLTSVVKAWCRGWAGLQQLTHVSAWVKVVGVAPQRW